LAPPEGIQAYGLGLDWTMWELSVPATPSPEWLLALGRLGLSVAGGRVQADWIGNTPKAWRRSKVLYPVFSVGDTPAVSVSGVRAHENEVSAFLLGPDGLSSVVLGAGDDWLLEMDELNEGDYLLEIVPRNTAIEPARLPFRVEPRTPVHLSCRTEVSLGEETINITGEHEVEWDLSQAETEGLTIRGPALWPVRLVGFGQRKLRVGPDGMLDLTGFLEHTRDQREKERMARVIVDFGELGRLSIEHRRQVSIKQLRQRLQQMFAASGHLSERAAHNQGLFLNGWLGPLTDLLGYHLRRHELEHSCSAFVLTPKVETEAELRALVLAPFGADLRESYAGSARELANLLCEQRGYSSVFLSDGIRWAVHENGRRFMGRPLHLGEALEDESGELLEEFLARHLAEGL
ncbi:MAG: hypothetical protein KC910_35885, partial [Candidatus Eremiobacteraeota bacterium]|nr:hypothetical protein [Candidatus Eremiobacteraeota bacterium]